MSTPLPGPAPTIPAARARSGETRRERRRRLVLRAMGADAAAEEELLAYGANSFDTDGLNRFHGPPLPDEPFVRVWREYARASRQVGVVECLRDRLVQLRFPIREGISRTDAYVRATRKGVWSAAANTGLQFERPDEIRLRIHRSAAGRIPVITVGHRQDFVSLVQALTRRNEPVPIPPSVGACMVAGYNNWDRIAALREAWLARNPDRPPTDWTAEFRVLQSSKELYQDRFVVLSSGPYSGVAAESLGLAKGDWARRSLTIRLEHECAHYFTRRVFGSMRNALLDELIADYAGIVAAAGRFRADWFLRFMGLDEDCRDRGSRTGARIDVYRGSPPLSDRAFRALGRLVRLAAARLEAYDRVRFVSAARNTGERTAVIVAMASLTLEELASAHAHRLLDRALARLPRAWRAQSRRSG